MAWVYLKWVNDKKGVEGLSALGIETMYTEVSEDGEVLREIGIGKGGQVVHKCPGHGYKYGTYGLFDNQKVEISKRASDITSEEFERLWRQ